MSHVVSAVLVLLCMMSLSFGTHYVGVSDKKNWFDAKAACEAGIWVRMVGGKLATWDSYEQYRDGIRHANIIAGGNAWVGLTDADGLSGGEGRWNFIDGDNCGGDCDSLQEWSSVGNQPDDAGVGGQDCALVWGKYQKTKRGDHYGLDSANCAGVYPFVCEYDNFDQWDGGNEWLNQPGRADVLSVPLESPNDNSLPQPETWTPNTIKQHPEYAEILAMASLVLNVVLISLVCCLAANNNPNGCCAPRRSYYKVDLDAIEEKI